MTFSDPLAWRDVAADAREVVPTAVDLMTKVTQAETGVVEKKAEASSPPAGSTNTWFAVSAGEVDRTAYGYNEKDYLEIKAAADRAARSKGRRR